MTPADFIVLDGILHKHLYGHGRKFFLQCIRGNTNVKIQILFITHLQQIQISMYKVHFLCQSNRMGIIILQGIAQNPGEFLQIILRLV